MDAAQTILEGDSAGGAPHRAREDVVGGGRDGDAVAGLGAESARRRHRHGLGAARRAGALSRHRLGGSGQSAPAPGACALRPPCGQRPPRGLRPAWLAAAPSGVATPCIAATPWGCGHTTGCRQRMGSAGWASSAFVHLAPSHPYPGTPRVQPKCAQQPRRRCRHPAAAGAGDRSGREDRPTLGTPAPVIPHFQQTRRLEKLIPNR